MVKGEGEKEEGEVEIWGDTLFLAQATESVMVPHSLSTIYPCQVLDFSFLSFQG